MGHCRCCFLRSTTGSFNRSRSRRERDGGRYKGGRCSLVSQRAPTLNGGYLGILRRQTTKFKHKPLRPLGTTIRKISSRLIMNQNRFTTAPFFKDSFGFHSCRALPPMATLLFDHAILCAPKVFPCIITINSQSPMFRSSLNFLKYFEESSSTPSLLFTVSKPIFSEEESDAPPTEPLTIFGVYI